MSIRYVYVCVDCAMKYASSWSYDCDLIMSICYVYVYVDCAMKLVSSWDHDCDLVKTHWN